MLKLDIGPTVATFAEDGTPADPPTPPAPTPGAPAPTPPAPGAAEFGTQLADLAKSLEELKNATFPTPGSDATSATFEKVDEEPLYRFDGIAGKRDFSTDLAAAFSRQDPEARQHLQEFLAATFAVTPAGVASVNPNRYRPELYVDYIEKSAPTYAALFSGAIGDATPFVVPKFGTASNMVNAHTSGTEPGASTFTTTSQTVTPSILSGLSVIPREIIDAGGNPQVSGLIWRQMQRAYAEALEAEAAGLLNAATATELGAAIVGAAALNAGVIEALANVPFIDGGDLMDVFLGHVDLYKGLAGELDTTGRPLYPYLSPSNSEGSAAAKFRRLDVAGWDLVPAKTLGATGVNSKSYVLFSDAAHVWNSAPQQIQYENTANVSVGLFGYKASAVTQAALLHKITYTAA